MKKLALLLLFIFPSFTLGAIAFVSSDDPAGASTFSFTVSSVTDGMLVVIGGVSGGGCTAITYNGDSLTKEDEGNNYGEIQSIWTLANPDVGTANIVATGCSLFGVGLYSGVDSVDSSNNVVVDTTSTLTITDTVVGTDVWLVGGYRNTTTNSSAGTGTTIRELGAWCSNSCGLVDSNGTVGTGNQSLVLTSSGNTDWTGVIIGLLPATGGGGGGIPDTETATSTSAILGSINFGLGVIIVIMSIGISGYIYNTFNRKKSWH